MMQQYMLASKITRMLLFYRLEIFMNCFDDAIQASQLLEITLTARAGNTDNPIPM